MAYYLSSVQVVAWATTHTGVNIELLDAHTQLLDELGNQFVDGDDVDGCVAAGAPAVKNALSGHPVLDHDARPI
jgi:hypothetical protein